MVNCCGQLESNNNNTTLHGTSINEVPGDWGELFVIEGSLYRTPRFNEFSKKKKKNNQDVCYIEE